ncbi:MAG: hypothetical protein H7A25_10660 [Leptospiraceae bacterium]|nr:hypothetical protein [Leptospiraceae bacterium]MCP5500355.1 hypothetical protein [Leptospiraceae bacterium]
MKKFLFCSFLFLISLSNCFEYEESLYFIRGFSGYVQISYKVPLQKKKEESLIRFLPIQEEEINKRINKGLFSNNLKIRNYKIEILPASDNDPIFGDRKKAKVVYKIDFKEISQLDGVILGSLFVTRKDKTLSVRREFKSLRKSQEERVISPGEKKIHNETLKYLGEGYVRFNVYFPVGSRCETTKSFCREGQLSYIFSLSDTLEKPGLHSWFYKISLP